MIILHPHYKRSLAFLIQILCKSNKIHFLLFPNLLKTDF